MSEDLWLVQFRETVDALSTTEVARRLGCSSATVSQIYHGKYASPLEKWRERFLDAFSPAQVDCPVLGMISRPTCATHRGRGFAATNPVRVQLFRTCPTCANNPDRDSHE